MCDVYYAPMEKNRNLEVHRENRVGKTLVGNCDSCAHYLCMYNTTVEEILTQVDEGGLGAVECYSCDDQVDDPTMEKDQRT